MRTRRDIACHRVGATLARVGAILSILAVSGCGQWSVVDPAGQVGAAEKQILIDSLIIMLAIVVPTILATLAFGWWFRAGNARATYLPNFTYSGRIELVTWGVPLLTIMLLGGVTWVGSHELDPSVPIASDTPALEVQVVSLDWKWLFIYPKQGVAAVNQLMIPANTPVHFTLTSASVLNSFFIPNLGSQIYTMNGMAVSLNLIADRAGTFAGMSTHYSGDGFSNMHFAVTAAPQAGFDAWVASARAAGDALDTRAYAKLEEQSVVGVSTYRDVEPNLFSKIVDQTIPPAGGPSQTDISSSVSHPSEHN